MTEIVTPALGKIEDIFKSLVWDNLLAAVFIEVPWLAIWPVQPIVVFVADKLFDVLRECLDLEVIGFRNQAHKKAFDSASVTLRIIAHDKGIDSEEFRKAKENAKEALAKFVSYSGT